MGLLLYADGDVNKRVNCLGADLSLYFPLNSYRKIEIE